MNMRMNLILLAGCVALAGCNGGGGSYTPKPVATTPVQTAKEGLDQNYVPFAEGKQWTYTSETVRRVNGRMTKAPDQEVIYKITKVEKIPEGQQITWEIKVGDRVSDRQIWIATEKGIFQTVVGLKEKKFTTPQPLVLFPVSENQTFDWRGSGALPDGTLGSNVVKSHVDGMQEVDTEMGRVQGLAISSDLDFATSTGRGKGDSTIWLSPGLGIVRFTQTVAQGPVVVSETLRLKSHS